MSSPKFITAAFASLSAMLGLSGVSCTTEAYCFVCDSNQLAAGGTTTSVGAGGTAPNISFGGTTSSGGSLAIGGTTVLPDAGAGCDKDIQNDPKNCGSCGYECELFGAFPRCENAKCVIDKCADGYRDSNLSPADGCEYACEVFPPLAAELCNGKDDDCDSEIDEGFELTTVDNCGSCGNECQLTQASAKCVPSGSGRYTCDVDQCSAGYIDYDNLGENGCEYKCQLFPPKDKEYKCDGIDEDCDGVADDGEPEAGLDCNAPCPGGVCRGQCKPGKTSCIGGAKACLGGVGPALEKCNGLDDDCNGVIDNGFNTAQDPLNCGGCTELDKQRDFRCNLPNAVEGCTASKCTVLSCEPGYTNLDGNPVNGCEHKCAVYPTSVEICDGKDNDCDGKVDTADNDMVSAANFCTQTGPCKGATASCVSGGWRCNYKAINPNIEVTASGALALVESSCDAFDNNCDGQKDEAFLNLNQDCTAGHGACQVESKYVCSADKRSTICPANANNSKAVDETCNGVDDNCDGQVDERTPAGDVTCSNGGSHPCKGFIDPMVKVGNVWVYQFEASRPDASVSENGIDNSRACSKPGVLPWTSLNRGEAVAACAAVKDSKGAAMRLCSESEWQAACSANQAGTRWSYSTGSNSYLAGACNDGQFGTGAPWVTGFDNGKAKDCYANIGNGIFDMSGNVGEWTNSCVTVNGLQYCRIRGGSYLSFGPATACDFSFVLAQPAFANFDVGFRCCSVNAP